MIKQLYIFIVCCLLLLVGCSSETTIRQELYDDSLKYYNLMNEKITAIGTYTEEDKKNLNAYSDKYDRMLKELNEEERYLFSRVSGMAMSLDLMKETYLILDEEAMKVPAESFVRSKLEAAKILGIEE